MKRIILFIGVTILLFSCREANLIHVKFDKVDGLEEKSSIMLNGKVVGEIENIAVDKDYKILVSIKLTEIDKIPIDSKFVIKPSSILINKSVFIETGISETFIEQHDTVAGYFETKSLVDTLVNKGLEIMKKIEDETQEPLDSINAKSSN